MIDSAGNRLFNLTTAAAFLGVRPSTVREYIHRGELRARLIGCRWRISQADLLSFYEAAPASWEECQQRLVSRRTKS